MESDSYWVVHYRSGGMWRFEQYTGDKCGLSTPKPGCPVCNGAGTYVTSFGQEILDFVRKHLKSNVPDERTQPEDKE